MADWRTDYLKDVRREFAAQQKLAERAIAQIDDDALLRTADDHGNSIAVLMKHVGGNLRSRWTEPFDTDGEKPDRNRDGEFEDDDVARVREVWQTGWSVLDATLGALVPADLDRELRIRGEPLSLVNALNRSLAHTAQHVGQIIMLARMWRGDGWQSLSIPRGESAKYMSRPPGS